MSVAELIARLQEMPQDAQVYIRDLFSYEDLSEDDIQYFGEPNYPSGVWLG